MLIMNLKCYQVNFTQIENDLLASSYIIICSPPQTHLKMFLEKESLYINCIQLYNFKKTQFQQAKHMKRIRIDNDK